MVLINHLFTQYCQKTWKCITDKQVGRNITAVTQYSHFQALMLFALGSDSH